MTFILVQIIYQGHSSAAWKAEILAFGSLYLKSASSDFTFLRSFSKDKICGNGNVVYETKLPFLRIDYFLYTAF